ncbi:hypothetical protein BS627_19235 [Agrobacterium salinitolerans]|nr:hypothetical protein BS627_19235 [Agrobacterium salinitolerans]
MAKRKPLLRHARACPEHLLRIDWTIRWQILGTRPRMTSSLESGLLLLSDGLVAASRLFDSAPLQQPLMQLDKALR